MQRCEESGNKTIVSKKMLFKIDLKKSLRGLLQNFLIYLCICISNFEAVSLFLQREHIHRLEVCTGPSLARGLYPAPTYVSYIGKNKCKYANEMCFQFSFQVYKQKSVNFFYCYYMCSHNLRAVFSLHNTNLLICFVKHFGCLCLY